MAEFVPKEKGNPLLLFNGYLFVKEKEAGNRTYWKCQNYNKHCNCRAKTAGGEIISVSCEHNHTANPAKVEARRIAKTVKTEPEETPNSPQFVISNVASHNSTVTTPVLPLHNHTVIPANVEAPQLTGKVKIELETCDSSPPHVVSTVASDNRFASTPVLPSVSNMKRTIQQVPREKRAKCSKDFPEDPTKTKKAKFVQSEKGKPMLLVDGYLFVKDKELKNKKYWKCQNYKKYCKCRAKTDGDEVISVSGEHNHAGNPVNVEVRRFMEKIKNDSKETHDSPQYVILNAASDISNLTVPALPPLSSIKRTIRRVRQREICGLPVPNHRKDITFLDEYTKTNRGDDFLLFDSGPSEDRMLIFSTRQNLYVLDSCQNVFMDGSFKTVPVIFDQLYTIQGLKNGFCLPLIFGLLPNRKEETYIKFVKTVKTLVLFSNIDSITTDFEPTMIKAVRTEFDSVNLYGSFFHLGHCLYKKVCAFDLKEKYNTDAHFSLSIRMLLALAFVPTEQVYDAFGALVDEAVYPPEALPVVDYFEDTWLGRPCIRNGRRPPIFDLKMWSCFDRVQQNLPETNNAIEVWHRAFLHQVSANRSTIWRFIEELKREQSLNEINIEKLLSGMECESNTKECRISAKQLKKLTESFQEYTNVVDYLCAVAHNVRL
ncbi:uncharacterized protein LOC115219713 [Octopus sinensis]|uniref:Uncharacterized protein LOC115219713 n=1 Tax=Octopus sinensis TaxID=2607531 RepID=A0A6P7T4J1_9MOLL|nr:uncharacterized protein LOC115219713 [Octopus sinensis]